MVQTMIGVLPDAVSAQQRQSQCAFALDKKRKNVAKLAEEKKSLAHKYFPPELTDRIDVWKGARNKIIHALMKQDLHTEDLSAVALDGQALVKTLCSKTSLYNRALERQANKENGK